jgi:hypothetical protein
MTSFQKKTWIGLFIMALLTPLGVVLPKWFNAEDAWGEWGIDKIEKLLGYIPAGMKKVSEIWKAPIPDYNFGGESASMATRIASYIISGVIGILLISIAAYALSKFLVKREK